MLSEKIFVELYTSKSFHGALKKKLSEHNSTIPFTIVDDIIQVIFLRAWKYRKSFNSKKSKPTSWILTIAGNIRREYLGQRAHTASNVSSDIKGLVTPLGQLQFLVDEDGGDIDITDAVVPVARFIDDTLLQIKTSREQIAAARTRPMRMAICHPNKKHYANDKCQSCYKSLRKTKKRKAARKAAKKALVVRGEAKWQIQVQSQSKTPLTIVSDCSDNVRSLSATP